MVEEIICTDGDSVFYRTNPGPSASWCTVKLHLDWMMLARQKMELLRHIDDEDSVLWGLIEVLDAVQDQAEEDGHPVVWVRLRDD